ncbi:MAG: hypothetical protein IJO59_03260 [Clostridia bacterium]|nr:hypothetical protein [Clostridia bacterium]
MRFPYQIIGEDYPDTFFNVYYFHKVKPRHLKKLEDVLGAYMSRHSETNGEEDDVPIHYIGEAELSKEDPHLALIHIDFGGEPEVIWDVLSELDTHIRGIEKVIVE